MLPDPSGKALRPESELTPGFEFTPWRLSVDRETQAQKLRCCGIDPAIWGDIVDPGIFATLTIKIVNREGFSINGSVHMIQTYKIHSQIELGEEVEMRGRITGIEPAPRGCSWPNTNWCGMMARSRWSWGGPASAPTRTRRVPGRPPATVLRRRTRMRSLWACRSSARSR